jgi:hypothetical protein
MNDYEKLCMEISEKNIKRSRNDAVKRYLINNHLAILALIVAIIALFK